MSELQVFVLAIILFVSTGIHHFIVELMGYPLRHADAFSIDAFGILTITTTFVELGVIYGAFWLIEHVRFV